MHRKMPLFFAFLSSLWSFNRKGQGGSNPAFPSRCTSGRAHLHIFPGCSIFPAAGSFGHLGVPETKRDCPSSPLSQAAVVLIHKQIPSALLQSCGSGQKNSGRVPIIHPLPCKTVDRFRNLLGTNLCRTTMPRPIPVLVNQLPRKSEVSQPCRKALCHCWLPSFAVLVCRL